LYLTACSWYLVLTSGGFTTQTLEKSKGQPRMDNPESNANWSQDTEQRQNKTHTENQKDEQHKPH